MTVAAAAIERAEAIRGWMSAEELRWLAERASQCRTVVEVGCFLGRSTRALADNCPGVVWAVDNWVGESAGTVADERRSVPKGAFTSWGQYESLGPDVVLTHFVRNMRDLLGIGRVKMCRNDSVRAAELFLQRRVSADLVFLDGDHGYEHVAADIRAWRPVVRPGGILAGHDYDGVPWHSGVRAAVNERFRDVSVCGSIWWTVL